MKRITLLITILLGWTVSSTFAQEYRHKLGNTPDKIIEFAVSQSDIQIEGHSGDELVIRNLDYEAPPERAQGLRALYGGGEDNTGIGITVEEDGNTLRMIPVRRGGGEFVLQVPNRVRLMIEEVNWGSGDLVINNHNGDIEFKGKNGDITMTNITGPVTVSTTSGDIEIVFSQVSQDRPTSISNISGFIDITLPTTTKANFIMSSISGEIYTDMDIQLKGTESKGSLMRLGGGNKIEGTTNGGGVEIGLKTISGEIYLRKK